MNTYVLLEAKGEWGISLFTYPINLNNPRSISEAVLLFTHNLYAEHNCSDFNPEYYYQLDFDSLFKDESVILNDNLHISLMYGIGESV